MNSMLRHRRKKTKQLFKKSLLYALLFFLLIVIISPLFFMLIWGTWNEAGIFQFPPKLRFGPYLVKNFNYLRQETSFVYGMLNSILVSLVTTSLTLFVCTLAGFAFAKYKFKGKEILFYVLLATLTIPYQAVIIPLFIIMLKLHWVDTYYAVIVPSIASVFGLFLMRNSIHSSIPNELLDAARIDGMSEYGIYGKIVLPLSLPSIAALGILAFMGNWNSFVWPLIVLRSKEMQVVTTALNNIVEGGYPTHWGPMLLGSSISLILPLIMFLTLQKYFVKGILIGSFR